MSSTLVRIASDATRRNGQVIDETAINLFSGLSKILNAAFFTGVKITKTDGLFVFNILVNDNFKEK